MNTGKETLYFLRESFNKFHDTGSLFPTSKWAAVTLSSPIRQTPSPRRILELGSGTGAVTQQIAREMGEGDSLACCEMNPTFMDLLKRRVATDPEFGHRRDQVEFFLGPAQEIPGSQRFNVVICALPFLNFSVEIVEAIFDRLYDICEPATLMSFYQYYGLKKLNKRFGNEQRKKNVSEVEGFFRKNFPSPQIERVYLNILPIDVFIIKLSRINSSDYAAESNSSAPTE